MVGAHPQILATDRPRSWAEVDRGAFARNVARIAALVPGRELLAVLKADAYGHGAALLAPVAVAAGAAWLGVGDSTEALELREAGVQARILVLGALVSSEIPRVVAEGITPVIHGMGRALELEAEARRQGRVLGVHVKVDTGMGRLGLSPARLPAVAGAIAASPWLRLEGLMSHLAGQTGSTGNLEQRRCFEACVDGLSRAGIRPPVIHLRNSAGILDEGMETMGETLVRAGAQLYGFHQSGHLTELDTEPVLSLRTQIVFLKDVGVDHAVGYGGTWRAQRPSRLAVLPLGYHDGIPPGIANRGEVLVRGARAPIRGTVSMDYTTIDITDVPGAVVGDTATVIGADAGDRISAEQVAAWSGTIPHAVLCGLSRRVVRRPLGGIGIP